MSTEQLNFSEQHESDDNDSGSDSKVESVGHVESPVVPRSLFGAGRPMFEHIVPPAHVERTPEPVSPEKDTDDDEDDDDAPSSAGAAATPSVDVGEATDAWTLPEVATGEFGEDQTVESEPFAQGDNQESAEPISGADPEDLGELPLDSEATTEPFYTAESTPSAPVPFESAPPDDEDTTTPLPVPPFGSGGGTVPPSGPSPESTADDDPDDPDVYKKFAYSSSTPPSLSWVSMPNTPNAAPTAPYNALLSRAEQDARRRELLLALVAGFVAGWAVKSHLAKNKLKRVEEEHKQVINQHTEAISDLQYENKGLNQRVSAQNEQLQDQKRRELLQQNQPNRFEQPVPAAKTPEKLPPLKTPEEHIFDQEGNEIILQPGWHVERSAGGYSAVLNERNEVIHDAINYGEAFKNDRRREQVREDVFAAIDNAAVVPTHDSQVVLPLAQTQLDPTHELEAGQSLTVDVQHRLTRPRNPIKAIAVSPWLWTGIAVLLIVYFLAALA